MSLGAIAAVTRLPGWATRWALAHSREVVRSARLRNEVRCLAELARCLDGVDEGYVFHAPFLVVKGRAATGRSRLFAARLSAIEVDDFRHGQPLPDAVGAFMQSLEPGWKRVLWTVLHRRRRITARELPQGAMDRFRTAR